MTSFPPKVGSRISYMEHIGTIRFIGPVDGTSGDWLGVEWDDPTRGKHDGMKDGKRYFTCLVPGAGSFLRPSAKILLGKSFLEAIRSKYVEAYHGSDSQEVVVLGSSQGTIQVEAVNLDKVRGKLANLSTLREVSLDDELVARSDPPGTIRITCPNIRGLDLSRSLISSWNTVAEISQELALLQRLSLNHNRFQQPVVAVNAGCFDSLVELRLNNTFMTWQDVRQVVAAMPRLQELEMGYNHLTNSSFDPNCNSSLDLPIQAVNLDSNRICSWPAICAALKDFPFLQRVILANNQIKTIPFPLPQQGLNCLTHLSLSFNRLNLWSDISALAYWAPSLESLALIGNPITYGHIQNMRPLVIARLATLRILDGAAISVKERRDAELYYLSYIASQGPVTEEERCHEHPRWQDLCEKYGRPDEIAKLAPDTLKNRLLELKLYHDVDVTTTTTDQDVREITNTAPIIIRVLPTMLLKTLRIKVRKALKCKATEEIRLLLVMTDYALVTLNDDRNNHDLAWIGMENGTEIICAGGI